MEKIPNTFKSASPCILVVFGITGDLMKRLLFPAICNLGVNNLLDNNFCIVGTGRKAHDHESFRQELKKNIDEFISDEKAKNFAMQLLKKIYYIAGDFSDPNLYLSLTKKLTELNVTQNYLFYFASPPESIPVILNGLNTVSLLQEEKNYFRRIAIEKPFGEDLSSAKKLNQTLLAVTKEEQIYRVDHFLGKETIQNILAVRFSNVLFEPIWNAKYIDNVQITVAETLGVEMRGDFYEHTGALRDMIPNHLFQMLSLLAMETPSSFSAEAISPEKEKVLQSMQRLTADQVLSQVVRGQYDKGKIDGKEVVAYRSEQKVSPHSDVETYVALKLFLNNARWKNVPFYLRTGKRMAAHVTEINIQFKPASSTSFITTDNLPNLFQFFIQPQQGISLRFNAKIPGPELVVQPFNLKFDYSDYFNLKPLTGYENILYGCMTGNHMIFKPANMVETEWELVQPILEVWKNVSPTAFPNYAAGTWGPKEADELINKDNRKWLG